MISWDRYPDAEPILLGYSLAWPKALVFEISIIGSNPITSASISRCSEMASPVVWDHVAQVRFLPPKPIF